MGFLAKSQDPGPVPGRWDCPKDPESRFRKCGIFFYILDSLFIFDEDFDVSEPLLTFNCPERSE